MKVAMKEIIRQSVSQDIWGQGDEYNGRTVFEVPSKKMSDISG